MKEILSIKKITKKFHKVVALNNFSLSLNKNDILTIIGPSGSGKSTVLRCILGLEKVNEGEIKILGKKLCFNEDNKSKYVKNDEQISLLKNVGMVFQNFNLFPHKSVMENLTLAPSLKKDANKKEVEEKAKKLLKKVGLIDKMNDYPFSLSGGQKQRVAIARALMLEPAIMLFDEPTSALDPELTQEVLKTIKALKEEQTMIIVTHEMAFAKSISNKTIFLDKGEIVLEGDTNFVFSHKKNERVNQFLKKLEG